MNLNFGTGDFGGPLIAVWLLIGCSTLLIHIAFAVGVASDTIPAKFVSRFIWILATLIAGPIVGCMYWVIHHGIPSPSAPTPPNRNDQRPTTSSRYHSDPPPRSSME